VNRFPGRLSRLLPWLLALVLLLPAAPALALDGARTWSLDDLDGQRWGVSLFEQPDPDYPSGLRLRLNARSPGLSLDHGQPLAVRDGQGNSWSLPNRSEELVTRQEAARGEAALPATSAQFDAVALDPPPSPVMPLQLDVPLAGGDERVLQLEPDLVRALHAALP
jgi:hypothetical protein